MKDCIFCQIANGTIPSSKVFENDDFVAFNDLAPTAPVHVLVVPNNMFKASIKLRMPKRKINLHIFSAPYKRWQVNSALPKAAIASSSIQVLTVVRRYPIFMRI